MKYYFFLDETGNHGLSFVDKNFPFFLLCGCLFSEKEYERLDVEFKKIKRDIFKNENAIFHSRDIRKCEKDFSLLFDLKIKEQFYKKLNHVIQDVDFTIISAAIQKERHIRKYGKQASDPYSISLSFIIERLIFYLDDLDNNAQVQIFVESRGRKENKILLQHFNGIFDSGTSCVNSDRVKNRVSSFGFKNKIDNDNGIQVADLCAYPLVRHLIFPEKQYIPYEVLENKIYTKNGKVYGLKIFP